MARRGEEGDSGERPGGKQKGKKTDVLRGQTHTMNMGEEKGREGERPTEEAPGQRRVGGHF